MGRFLVITLLTVGFFSASYSYATESSCEALIQVWPCIEGPSGDIIVDEDIVSSDNECFFYFQSQCQNAAALENINNRLNSCRERRRDYKSKYLELKRELRDLKRKLTK